MDWGNYYADKLWSESGWQDFMFRMRVMGAQIKGIPPDDMLPDIEPEDDDE